MAKSVRPPKKHAKTVGYKQYGSSTAMHRVETTYKGYKLIYYKNRAGKIVKPHGVVAVTHRGLRVFDTISAAKKYIEKG